MLIPVTTTTEALALACVKHSGVELVALKAYYTLSTLDQVAVMNEAYLACPFRPS